ncbi:universal stress protein [Microvirga roseola]|uniref:universal stress protein n=1 Tax=Microvirga roseola TaxID=2883126 RepID=UPI001E44B12E|nr:universal stress protein [Microvirga roseola]
MIKDVLVHLDGSAQDEERLRYAEAVAAISQAHVTGLLTNPLPDMPMIAPMDSGAAAAEALVSLEEEARQTGGRIQRKLAERCSRLGVPNEIRRVDALFGQLPRRAASEARWADLFVASRPYDGNGAMDWSSLFEAVLFESGRGILVVPPGHRPPGSLRRVLVCWRDTREAARAVAEASPLIAKATRTVVLAIDPEPRKRDGVGSEPAADVAKHLTRLGTSVEVNLVESQNHETHEVILDQARRLSADLIVMGGYGHSRAREWMIGGATRSMLTVSESPVLIAH